MRGAGGAITSLGCDGPAAIREAAANEAKCIAKFAQQIEHHGVDCPIRSVGSSPTALLGDDLNGIPKFPLGCSGSGTCFKPTWESAESMRLRFRS